MIFTVASSVAKLVTKVDIPSLTNLTLIEPLLCVSDYGLCGLSSSLRPYYDTALRRICDLSGNTVVKCIKELGSNKFNMRFCFWRNSDKLFRFIKISEVLLISLIWHCVGRVVT